jgi:hypothetical protein
VHDFCFKQKHARFFCIFVFNIYPYSMNIIRNFGIIYLKADLYAFLVQREKLDLKEPILDLSGRSVIKHELRSICQKIDDLHWYEVNKRKYTHHIKFIPDYEMSKMEKVYLDGQATAHFNRFLFHLRNELAEEHAQAIMSVMPIHKIQTLKKFAKKYAIGDNEIDYEHLRRDVSRMNATRKTQK